MPDTASKTVIRRSPAAMYWGWEFQICQKASVWHLMVAASQPGAGEELDLQEARHGEHGHAGVLDLGLAEPVEVDPDVVDVGEAEGVEAHVPGHGSVEK